MTLEYFHIIGKSKEGLDEWQVEGPSFIQVLYEAQHYQTLYKNTTMYLRTDTTDYPLTLEMVKDDV